MSAEPPPAPRQGPDSRRPEVPSAEASASNQVVVVWSYIGYLMAPILGLFGVGIVAFNIVAILGLSPDFNWSWPRAVVGLVLVVVGVLTYRLIDKHAELIKVRRGPPR